MMKLVHFADFHLGMENYGRLDPATGLSSRVGDFLRALDSVVDSAIENRIDAVLFAGDAYRSRDPSLTYQREFSRRLGRLASSGVVVALLVGNHDLPNGIGKATPLDIYETLAVERIHVFSIPTTRVIQTRGGPLQIVAMPWVRREGMFTAEVLRTKTADEIDLDLNEMLGTWIGSQVASLDPTIPAVLMAHASIAGATWGSERKVLLGRDLVLTGSSVDRHEFSYVAMGHIHKHQRLGAITPVVYSGSTERIDFGEEREDKGFIEVEIRAPREAAEVRFRQLPTRPFRTVQVQLGDGDPTEQVLDSIRRQSVDGTVLRIVVESTADQYRALRRNDIAMASRSAHFFAGIQQKVIDDGRQPERGLGFEELTVQEILRRYFESKRVSQERLKKLMAAAEELIGEQRQALR